MKKRIRYKTTIKRIPLRKTTKKYLKKLEKRETTKKFKQWSIDVKKRDKNKCVICGRTEFLHTHHIIPRENKIFRFDINNGITLCAKHHKFSFEISPHKNPFIFFIWFNKHRIEQSSSLYSKYLEKEKNDNTK